MGQACVCSNSRGFFLFVLFFLLFIDKRSNSSLHLLLETADRMNCCCMKLQKQVGKFLKVKLYSQHFKE